MSEIELSRLGEQAVDAAVELLGTMAGYSAIVPGGITVIDQQPPDDEAAAFVGLQGDCEGGVWINASMKVAQKIARRMLMMEASEDLCDEDVRDALGEVANIVSGGLKTRAAELDVSFSLDIPVIALSDDVETMQEKAPGPYALVTLKLDGENLELYLSMARSASPAAIVSEDSP